MFPLHSGWGGFRPVCTASQTRVFYGCGHGTLFSSPERIWLLFLWRRSCRQIHKQSQCHLWRKVWIIPLLWVFGNQESFFLLNHVQNFCEKRWKVSIKGWDWQLRACRLSSKGDTQSKWQSSQTSKHTKKMRSCREMQTTHRTKDCNTEGWFMAANSNIPVLPVGEAVNNIGPCKTRQSWSLVYLGSTLICQWTQTTWLVLWRKLRPPYRQRQMSAAKTNTKMSC